MPGILNANKKLINAGEAMMRMADGTIMRGVPQYTLTEKSAPGAAVPLRKNERLVMIGSVHADRKASEKRFAEALAGRKVKPKFDGTPLYIKEAIGSSDSVLSSGEQKALNELVGDYMALFAAQQ